jgi:undecaprenyl-diphosphatase
MLAVFVGVGIIFIISEFLIKKDRLKLLRSLETLTYIEAAGIGLIQALAVMPGVSRAGAVILGMMFMKFKRDEAAKFSFLLAVPTIVAASGYDLLKMRKAVMGNIEHIELLIIGTIVSFVSAYFVVKWFVSFLQKHSLSSFGVYRIIAGLLLFFVK